MLEIDKLSIRRDNRELYYSLRLARGEIVALRGPSGAGKTTLLDAIAGFLAPDAGDIRWQGGSLIGIPPERRPISQLFQDHNLFEHLSVWRNLMLGFARQPPLAAVREASIALGVNDQLGKIPPYLSGGQRQRVALIRTLLRPQPLVLLDEPFAELDAQTRERTVTWTNDRVQNSGKTVLLVTHQSEDVSRMADREIQLPSQAPSHGPMA